MTRTYALRRLLEHGPLSFCQIVDITGWTVPVAHRALERLRDRGEVLQGKAVAVGTGRRHTYRLA